MNLHTIGLSLALLIPQPFVPQPSQKADDPTAKAAAQPDREELLTQFEKALTNVVMVGQHTSFPTGSTEVPEVKDDRYTITKVEHGNGDGWLIYARVQYGEKDVTTPIPVEVKWAGDTPVITITNFMIPFLGTYTTRLVVYKDRYAGTWSGLTHEGHLWGRIEKAKPKSDTTEAGDGDSK